MTEYLWTKESAWCLCGHHITDHTASWLCGLETSITCNGKDHKTGSNWSCKCDGFKPYRINQEPEEEYSCYYCDELKTTYEKRDYEYHIIMKHAGKPCYPSKADLEKFGLKPQGKDWEI